MYNVGMFVGIAALAAVTVVFIALRIKGGRDLGRELRRDRDKIQGQESDDVR